MQFDVLTLFPDLIYNYCDDSILGRAQKKELIKILAHDFREFTLDKQRHVDDRPYGGGPGMILQVQPIYDCLKAIGALSFKAQRSVIPSVVEGSLYSPLEGFLHSREFGRNDKRKTKIIIMDPAGKKFDQRMAEKFSKLDRLVIISGRYEGFDARVYKLADERVSVGDFVLAGGELAALSVVEATARLIPGVLGNIESLREETFGSVILSGSEGSLLSAKRDSSVAATLSQNDKKRVAAEYPQYTRPENFMGQKVPKVLLSGNHELIEKWRKTKSK